MATFEQPEMQVIKVGEEVPINLTKLTFEGMGQKLEDLNAYEYGEQMEIQY